MSMIFTIQLMANLRRFLKLYCYLCKDGQFTLALTVSRMSQNTKELVIIHVIDRVLLWQTYLLNYFLTKSQIVYLKFHQS